MELLEEAEQDDGNPVDTRRIIELLKLRHPEDEGEWAHFVELNSDTGFSPSRLDFFAIGCWSSTGHKTITYEIKVSRGDFKRELKNPHKRKRAEEVSTETYFATPLNLIQVEELPEGWGLIEATRGGLRIKRHAPQRTATLNHSFVASLARHHKQPKSELPPAIWNLMDGRKITEADLQKLMKSWVNIQTERQILDLKLKYEKDQREVQRQAVEDFKAGWEYGRMVRQWNIVKRVLECNEYMGDAELERLLLQRQGVEGKGRFVMTTELDALREALRQLDKATKPIIR